MSLFDTIFLIDHLPAWYSNLGMMLVKTSKLIMSDTGLLTPLLAVDAVRLENTPLCGAVVENFVIMELKKQISWSDTKPAMLHFRTQAGQEVDVVLEDRAGRVVGIEIKSAKNVDHFIANSNHIAAKIKRIYNRHADVIYPPVDTQKFSLVTEKEDYYLTASRLVPYKRIDMIVDAFANMLDKKLVVIGSGPEKEKIKAKATPNIDVIGYQDFDSLKGYMEKAKAFVFAAEEDFGIIVVEAMACGTPVIAGNFGGTSESVIDGKTGVLFPDQSVDSIISAVKKFEQISGTLSYSEIRNHSEKFSRYTFEHNIKEYVNEKLKSFLHTKTKNKNDR